MQPHALAAAVVQVRPHALEVRPHALEDFLVTSDHERERAVGCAWRGPRAGAVEVVAALGLELASNSPRRARTDRGAVRHDGL